MLAIEIGFLAIEEDARRTGLYVNPVYAFRKLTRLDSGLRSTVPRVSSGAPHQADPAAASALREHPNLQMKS